MLIFQPLTEKHGRTSFDCGVPDLNQFLQKTARQHREKGLSNTYVLLDETDPLAILGYFTLSFLEVDSDTLPVSQTRKLPKSSRLPAAKLARLAVALNYQGKGYGALMLTEAIRRVVLTSQEAGAVTGFFVDAKDEQACNFYLHYGFLQFIDNPFKLFLPLGSLRMLTGSLSRP